MIIAVLFGSIVGISVPIAMGLCIRAFAAHKHDLEVSFLTITLECSKCGHRSAFVRKDMDHEPSSN